MSRRRLLPYGVLLAATGIANPAAEATTLSFQEGVGGYSGVLELFIGLDSANIPGAGAGRVVGSTVSQFPIDGRYFDFTGDIQELQLLMRYDNLFGAGPGQVPFGSKIVDASLTFTTGEGSDAETGSAAFFGISQIVAESPLDPGQPWLFTELDTWNSVTALGGGGGATFAGGQTSRPLDRGFGGPNLASNLTLTTPVISKASANITRMVQNWSNGEPNQGFAVRAAGTNAWQVFTSGAIQSNPLAPIEELRPKLTVTYEPAPSVPTTTAVFQQNAGGYAGTTMSLLRSAVGDLKDGALLDQDFLDGAGPDDPSSADNPLLIKFDNLFASVGGSVPDGATILDAQLVLDTSGVVELANVNVHTRGDYGVRQMLVDWDTSLESPTPSLYAEFGGNGPDELQGEVLPVTDTTGALISDARTYLDVTQAVRNWQAGQPNYGLFVQSTGTTDGWFIHFLASDSPPQLQITYTTATVNPDLGDYNGDGSVDAADYTVWRDNLGTSNSLLGNGEESGASMGVVDQADYDLWVQRYGASATGNAIQAPEPTSVVMTLFAAVASVRIRRGRSVARW